MFSLLSSASIPAETKSAAESFGNLLRFFRTSISTKIGKRDKIYAIPRVSGFYSFAGNAVLLSLTQVYDYVMSVIGATG
jgi:hypothetical protein